MKNIWSVLCAKATIDQMTNSLSLNDCVDEATISFTEASDMQKDIKNIPVSITSVNLWYDEDTKEDRELDYVIEIYDPKGTKVGNYPIKAKLEKGKKRLRTLAQINTLQLTTEGRYDFRIKYKDNDANSLVEVAEIPIDIKFVLNIKK